MIECYTDGSYKSIKKRGGWAFIVVKNGKVIHKESQVSRGNTTNNRMEMIAIIQCLKYIKRTKIKAVIYSDSKYVKNGLLNWIKGWKNNGWKTSHKKDVKNKELWMMLDEIHTSTPVLIKWVKGHADNKWNNLVDELASNY